MRKEKNVAEYNHALHPRRPPSARWADYIEPEVMAKIKELWAALPPIHKHNGKLPMLIEHRPE